ncbi:ABC transporter substrate-binding protein [Janthinobacterium lividum]|nr:ABC transporter substrate-binding protein [Janthinobacterium lividum]
MSLKFLRLRWRKVFATAVVASLLAPAIALAAAAEPLPAAVRIAVVARTAPSGKTVFAGSAAQVASTGWLAAELGKLGVKLEWVPVTTNSVATQVNEAFANHSIDLAQYGDLPSIIANASGLQTRLILPGGSANNTYLVVPNGSTARSIKDLKGKKIALHRGRPWEYPFARLLEANGMTLRDVKILNLNPQAGAAAVATGGAEAFFTLSDAFLLEDKKVGKIIWSSKAPPQDWKMRAELWADSGFLQRYPQLAQLVVTAYVCASTTGPPAPVAKTNMCAARRRLGRWKASCGANWRATIRRGRRAGRPCLRPACASITWARRRTRRALA